MEINSGLRRLEYFFWKEVRCDQRSLNKGSITARGKNKRGPDIVRTPLRGERGIRTPGTVTRTAV